MALASYVRGVITCRTPLDVSKCTNIHFTVEQDISGSKIDLTDYDTNDEFGIFIFKLTGWQTQKLKNGIANVQMRGFVAGKEFYTPQYKVEVDKILLKDVLADGS